MTESTQTTIGAATDPNGPYSVHETYVTALQNESAVLPPDAWVVGVVNIPMYGLSGVTETNLECLGPPAELFDAFRDARDEREADGEAEIAAHNAAWDDVSFGETYREHLEDEWEAGSPVRDACDEIFSKLSNRPVAIVCYEGTDKKCHRHVLQEFLNDKHDDGETGSTSAVDQQSASNSTFNSISNDES